MSAFAKIVLLAVVQGLTEFLPVSSSGHLVLAKHFVGLDSPGIVLEVVLHAGTLMSILVYYRRRIFTLAQDVVRNEARARYYVLTMAVACVPAVGVYLLLGDRLEGLFAEPRMTAGMLCATGVILLSLRFLRSDVRDVSLSKAWVIGLAQAVAMVPGISRSGITIVCGRHMGLSAGRATEFSLFIAIPVLAGSALVKLMRISSAEIGDLTLWGLAVGVAVAAIVGYVSIMCLVKALSSGKLWLFGLYCVLAGIIGLICL